MNVRREIRRLAMQVLYQIDARGQAEPEEVLEMARSLRHWSPDEPDDRGSEGAGLSEQQVSEAAQWAREAWQCHEQADALSEQLAPGWPAKRQPAVDRAILRLGYYEMVSRRTPPKVAINEAVELAKRFSTERSGAFVNGVLDKMYRLLRRQGLVDEPAGLDESNPL